MGGSMSPFRAEKLPLVCPKTAFSPRAAYSVWGTIGDRYYRLQHHLRLNYSTPSPLRGFYDGWNCFVNTFWTFTPFTLVIRKTRNKVTSLLMVLPFGATIPSSSYGQQATATLFDWSPPFLELFYGKRIQLFKFLVPRRTIYFMRTISFSRHSLRLLQITPIEAFYESCWWYPSLSEYQESYILLFSCESLS